MAAQRGPQNNTMLYAVIVFAALFIVATVFAVVFYIKSEDHRTAKLNIERQIDELASRKQLNELGRLVGEDVRNQTRLGTLLGYVEQLTQLVLGSSYEDTSAQVKVQTVIDSYTQINEQLAEQLSDTEAAEAPVGLIRLAEILGNSLRRAETAAAGLRQQLAGLTEEYERLSRSSKETEDQLRNQVEMFAQQARQAEQSCEYLKDQGLQNCQQQLQAVRDEVTRLNEQLEEQHQQLLQTRAEYMAVKQSRDEYKARIDKVTGKPSTDVPAYKADGKVISVNNQAGIVYVNLGIKDHVYRGLTFSVYDKNLPIPADGKSKAEVEIVDIKDNVSVARIVRSEKKNPIIADDLVANLIWDSEKTNIFVVRGDFDLDQDGQVDENGRQRIAELIESWGGNVAGRVSIHTDFVVLGLPPDVPNKPTHQQLEVDPRAMEKYEQAVAEREAYQRAREEAQNLSVPIFDTERFLYFIGYRSLMQNEPEILAGLGAAQ